MSSSDVGRVNNLDSLDVVVDGDSHVAESIAELLEYIDGNRHSGANHFIESSNSPGSNIFASNQPSPHFYNRYENRLLSNFDLIGNDSEDLTEGDILSEVKYSPEAKFADMDEHGIDVSVLDPTMCLDINTITNPRFAVAITEGYNDWVLDTFCDHDENIKANILVPGRHRPDLAAEEIDRLADEEDVVGIQMPSSALWPPGGDRRYDPIYQAASDHDLPIAMHGSVGSSLHGFPTLYRSLNTFTEAHALVHPLDKLIHLTTLIFRGVPDRYPDVQWILQESGIAWIPFMRWRLDDHYLENSDELPGVDRLPSEIIDEQFSFTTQPLGHTEGNPEHMAYAIEMAGPENIMFSSDVPHPDFDTPSELFDRIYQHFDGDIVKGIMGENALATYAI